MSYIKYDGFELDYFDNANNFRNYQLKLIKKFLRKSLAEVGPGQGGLVNYYKNFVDKIYLIEPEKKLYKILKKKYKNKSIKIKNNTIRNINKKFQTIIYFDVLEHIKNDLNEVKEASKKLDKKGYLIFSVPAYQYFYNNFDKSVGHFKRYNRNDFIKIGKINGLKIEKLIYYDSVGFLLLILNKIFSLNEKNLEFKIKFWNFLVPISRLIDFVTFNQFGKSLLCVYRNDKK